ncbi:hypothetical protein [Streptomyces sp. HNM0574]|uniref:hypothetical protein n=1 Tax=Streptomyces sp. HNM0574 TaxID=2714954 RepID=UPI0019D19414|nr:hypothetical protein [Streptomyces sp. HNM0574]
MDPVSVGLLTAVAGGAGGELGRQVWTGLSALVRRPFGRGGNGQAVEVSSGEPELVALERAPDEVEHAQALSTALAVRAAVDPEFAPALREWVREAEQAREARGGDVHNEIRGGTFNGITIQGRDIHHMNVHQPPAAPREDPESPDGVR